MSTEHDKLSIEAVLARLELETEADPTVLRKLHTDFSLLYRKLDVGSSAFTQRERELLFWAQTMSSRDGPPK
jgi:hypothetical protein